MVSSGLFLDTYRMGHVCSKISSGLHESYNVPGTVGPQNWRLRVPPDYAARYGARCRAGQALDLPLALSMALRARGVAGGDLLRGLEAVATPAGASALRRPD